MQGPAPARSRTTFGEVFAVAEFRALWSAQVLSVAGDQLARVALTLLVFGRTHSALLAAVTFAASVVPTFVGGITLSGLADRLPRRELMIVCDLARAALVAVMAIPGMHIAALVCLLFVVTMIGAPFSSARAAIYPSILSGDRYVLGNAVTLTTIQFAQVLGFGAAGAVVGFFGVPASLLADAGTFLMSALITQLLVGSRPATYATSAQPGGSLRGLMAGLKVVFADARLRTPMLFGWLVAFYNAPEGIATPLAATLGGGAVAVGMILAAGPLGASMGALAFGRLVRPSRRQRWMGPLATAACAVLILFALRPALPMALVILLVSGLLDCFQIAASAAFVTATPPGQRGQTFGIAQAGMSLGQGTAMIVAGVAAEHHPPNLVVAAGGAIGAVIAIVVALGQARSSTRP